MIIAEEKEIFNSIATHIVTSELDDNWDRAILKMMVIADTVEFNLNFFYGSDQTTKKNTKLNGAFKCSLQVLKLHKLTNDHPNYKKWNRALFKLSSSSKANIEYIWDQELQDEVDGYNNELS